MRWTLAVLALVAASACAAPSDEESEAESGAEAISFGGEVSEAVGKYLLKFFKEGAEIKVWDRVVSSWHGFESLVKLFIKPTERAAVKELAEIDARAVVTLAGHKGEAEIAGRMAEGLAAAEVKLANGSGALSALQPAKGFRLGHAHGFTESITDPGLLKLIEEDAWKGKTVIDLVEGDHIASASLAHYMPAKTAKPLSALVNVDHSGKAFLDLSKLFEGTPFAPGGALADKFKLNDACCEILYTIARDGKNKGMPYLLPSFQKGYILKNPTFVSEYVVKFHPEVAGTDGINIVKALYSDLAIYNHPNVFAASQGAAVAADKIEVNAAGQVLTGDLVAGSKTVELKGINMCSGHTRPTIAENSIWVKALFGVFGIVLQVAGCG